MNVKKFVSFALVCVLSISLVACRGGGNVSTGTVAGTSTDTPPSSSSGSMGDVIELSYWYSMDGAGGMIFQRHIETFNQTIGAENNIHVTGVYQDWPGTNALMAAMSTDDVANMPDVIHMFSEYINLVRNGARTAWVENFITAESSTVSKEDLIANAVAAYSIGGRLIGVPYAVSALLLYYNIDHLAAAGYDAPPATIAAMAEMLPKLVSDAGANYGLNVRIDQIEFENFIVTQGPKGTYFGNNDSGHAGIMTELACNDAIAAFLAEWGKVIGFGAYKATKDSMNEEFAQGLNSMCIMSSARIPAIAELIGDSFEWGVSAIPKVSASDVGGACPSGSGLFMIDRDDPARLDAAWTFIQYLISPEAQADWLDGCGYVPVNVHATETEAYKVGVEAQPLFGVPFEILKNTPSTVVGSFCPNVEDVNSVIQAAMLAYASGDATETQTCTAIMDGIDSAFEDYFRANPIN